MVHAPPSNSAYSLQNTKPEMNFMPRARNYFDNRVKGDFPTDRERDLSNDSKSQYAQRVRMAPHGAP